MEGGSGVYHQQYNYDAGESVLEVFTDSDWASDRQSRRSVSCCLLFYGRCLLYAASRTQKVISLSFAEAEVYACSSGCLDAKRWTCGSGHFAGHCAGSCFPRGPGVLWHQPICLLLLRMCIQWLLAQQSQLLKFQWNHLLSPLRIKIEPRSSPERPCLLSTQSGLPKP